MCWQVAHGELPPVSAAVKSTTPMKSTTMEAKAATVPAMLMVFTPKAAEIPATPAVAVVGITIAIAVVGIIAIAVGIIVRIIIVVVIVMFLSRSSWHPNKRHYTC